MFDKRPQDGFFTNDYVKLIQKTEIDYYCPKCKQRFIRLTDSKELMPVNKN